MCRSCAEGGRRCPSGSRSHAHAAHNGRRRAARLVTRLRAAGLDARRAADGPTMYWWDRRHSRGLSPSRVGPIRDPRGEPWKPDGGLWAAPALATDPDDPASAPHDGFHTTWTRFLADDEPGDGHLTVLRPAAAAVTLQLGSEQDWAAACRRWPRTVTTSLGDTLRGFSFEAMRRDGVDAVHVPPGPLLAHQGPLYGWDEHSEVWLNPTRVRAGARTRVRWQPKHRDAQLDDDEALDEPFDLSPRR